jgi:hypothetical protein
LTTQWSAKDPLDKRDYWFNFAPMLPSGATLTAATVTIAAGQYTVTEPFADLVLLDHDVTDSTWVVIRVEGGVPGNDPVTGATDYDVQYFVTTNTGETRDLTKTLTVNERKAP